MLTWGQKSEFEYTGTTNTGTEIRYGNNRKSYVSAAKYVQLLNHFAGAIVTMGTSRDHPPAGSVGEWLQTNVGGPAIGSYVGPILVHEGLAIKEGSDIHFL